MEVLHFLSADDAHPDHLDDRPLLLLHSSGLDLELLQAKESLRELRLPLSFWQKGELGTEAEICYEIFRHIKQGG